MIVNAIYAWLMLLVTWLVAKLPILDVDMSGLHAADQYTQWIGSMVNIPAFAAVATFVVTGETALWTYRAILRIKGWLI